MVGGLCAAAGRAARRLATASQGTVARLAIVAVLMLLAASRDILAAQESSTYEIAIPTQRYVGDLDGMVERRTIRVLTVYSKTVFFFDNGTPRGIAFQALSKFGEVLNRELRTGARPVEIEFIPLDRDELLPALAEGRGDIVAAYLTITPEHERLVAFTNPLLTGVSEIAVTRAGAPPLPNVEALAGKTIYVRRSSSYWTSLEALNERFLRADRPPVILKPAPEELEDEDMLEMLNAGLLRIVIVGSHIATFWKQFLPRIHLNPQAAVLTEGDIAWAVRKDSLRLKARLDAFIRKYGVNTTFGAVTFREYMKSGSVLRNAADPAELRKFEQLVASFRRYGDQYSLDWMLMAAQGYQESRLNQNVRSAVGAIGVMQVMPDTGNALDVGDIRKTEPNIHAGVKYIRLLIDRNYSDAGIDDLNKGLFAFAAYNAGPATVASLRTEAARRHLDPNVWFNNVELVAAEKIGRQTVSYVRNIYKYYIAYKLVEEQVAETQRVTEELRKGRAR